MRKTAVKRERMRMRLIIFASATYVRQLLQVTCYRCMRREDLHGSSDRFVLCDDYRFAWRSNEAALCEY